MPPLCAGCPLVRRRRRASERRWVVIVPGSRFGDNLAAMCRLIRR
jgi:ribosomal protein L36